MKARNSLALLTFLAVASVSIALSAAGTPALAGGDGIATRSYVQTNLVSNIPGLAAITDPHLKNPWGMAVAPSGPIWVSDNAEGVATLYDGAGNPQPALAQDQLVVGIPAPPSAGAGAVGAPTGQAFHTLKPASPDFVVSEAGASGTSFFLFVTEDETIVG